MIKIPRDELADLYLVRCMNTQEIATHFSTSRPTIYRRLKKYGIRRRTPTDTYRIYGDRRFWGKVKKSSYCWEWVGTKCSSGYGSLRIVDPKTGRSTMVGAHRLAWEMHNGAIQDGMHVCHSCDNPACVNPDHLWLGTHADNMNDRNRKGRAKGGTAKGSAASQAKLMAADIMAIRQLASSGYLQKDLASAWGVHKATVNDIVLRKTWGHIL